MNEIITLRETLANHLAWHGARLNFLALFLIALIREWHGKSGKISRSV